MGALFLFLIVEDSEDSNYSGYSSYRGEYI